MNKKLQKIGEKLNITKKDIQKIQKIQKGAINKKLLVIIASAIIAVLVFILWLVWRREVDHVPPPPNNGYPFGSSAPLATMGGYLLTKRKKSKIATLLISAIAFLSPLATYQDQFDIPIPYNVYKRNL